MVWHLLVKDFRCQYIVVHNSTTYMWNLVWQGRDFKAASQLLASLEAKLVSSKHLIQVHFEILCRSVENMASHLLAKYITWSKSCPGTATRACVSCTWLPFLIGQVRSQVWSRPYLEANFGFSELQTFLWSPSKFELGTFYPRHTQSRFQVHLHYTWSYSVKPTNDGGDTVECWEL